MIEIEIPKDIRKYDAKLVGPFTTRQTICFVLAGGTGVLFNNILYFLPSDIRFFIITFLIVPFLLCGWFKPYGMTFEKFIRAAFVSNVLAPPIRKYKTKNIYDIDTDEKKSQKSDSVYKTKNSGKDKIQTTSPAVGKVEWLLTILLSCIPGINIIYILYLAIISKKSPDKIAWARAMIILSIVSLVITGVVITVLGQTYGISINDMLKFII